MRVRTTPIDIATWHRRATYEWFRNFEFPYLIVGADLEITRALAHWRANGLSPFVSTVYAVTRAANAVPALRQRMRGDRVVEHDRVHADFTVPEGEESFTVKIVEYAEDFRAFHDAAIAAGPAGFQPTTPDEPNDHLIFMSCLPWVRFNHVVQPIDPRSGSIPRIVWGKWEERDGRVMLPFSVQCHHALVDGLHLGRFYQELQRLLATPENAFV